MADEDASNGGDDGTVLHSPEHDLSGTTVDEAVAKAEQGSQVEGVHTPSGRAASGESRVEQMPEVVDVDRDDSDRGPED